MIIIALVFSVIALSTSHGFNLNSFSSRRTGHTEDIGKEKKKIPRLQVVIHKKARPSGFFILYSEEIIISSK